MPSVQVEIVRFVDERNPGWVECVLTDAHAKRHHFIEKVPIVSTEDLRSTSTYPRAGVIACLVDEEWTDDAGRALARINTDSPWGVESVDGETCFVMLAQEVSRP